MTITERAAALAATGPVCDSCLGRPFAARSFGLTNAERGRALRTTVAMIEDEPFEPVEPVDCWVCEGYCGTFDALADAVVDSLEGIAFETYQVGTTVPPLCEENDRLLREDAGLDPDAGELLKREVNREVGRRVGARTGAEVDFGRPDVLVVLDLEAFDPLAVLEEGRAVTSHAVDRQVNAAFVYGRYRKLVRDVPQTEWPCRECGGDGVQLGDGGEEPCGHCGGSGYLYETSVEQTVRPHVVEAMDGAGGTFHGAGREDVDARMLGTGRPFVLEVERPRTRSPDVRRLEAAINEAAAGTVEVAGLRLATHELVERVKEHDASKRYRAAVRFDEPVADADLAAAFDALGGTTVEQYTPQRVDHRRAGLTRERTVYGIDGRLVDEDAFDGAGDPLDVDGAGDPLDVDGTGDPLGVDGAGDSEGAVDRSQPDRSTAAVVDLHGEGGLYVKELIGGDDGRTEPSLAGILGTGGEVIALDVLAVEGEDEPFEREAYFRDEPRDGNGADPVAGSDDESPDAGADGSEE